MKDALFQKVASRLRPLETNDRAVAPTLFPLEIYNDNFKYEASTGKTMLFNSSAL
jgi:hypothetical protein